MSDGTLSTDYSHEKFTLHGVVWGQSLAASRSRVTVLTRKQIVWSPWVEFRGSLMSAGEAAHGITSTPRTFLEF